MIHPIIKHAPNWVAMQQEKDRSSNLEKQWNDRLNVLSRGPKIRHHCSTALIANHHGDITALDSHEERKFGFVPVPSSQYSSDRENSTVIIRYREISDPLPEKPYGDHHGYTLYEKQIPGRIPTISYALRGYPSTGKAYSEVGITPPVYSEYENAFEALMQREGRLQKKDQVQIQQQQRNKPYKKLSSDVRSLLLQELSRKNTSVHKSSLRSHSPQDASRHISKASSTNSHCRV